MYINDPDIYIDIIHTIKNKSINKEKRSFKEIYFVSLVQSLIDEHLEKGGYSRVAFESLVSEMIKEK